MAGELAERIGHNIRAARVEAGLNQRELAHKIDDPAASNTHVSEWERGVRKPSDRYMPLIADALGKDVAWFYADHEHKQPDVIRALSPASANGDGNILARLDGIEEKIDRLGERLEVGISNQEKLLAGISAGQADYFGAVQEGIESITSLLAPATGERPAKPSSGRGRSERRAS